MINILKIVAHRRINFFFFRSMKIRSEKKKKEKENAKKQSGLFFYSCKVDGENGYVELLS